MNIVSLCIYTDQCRPLNTFIINKSKHLRYTRKSPTITLIVLVILSNDRYYFHKHILNVGGLNSLAQQKENKIFFNSKMFRIYSNPLEKTLRDR